MQKLNLKQKDEINAQGLISSLVGYGGWGLATTAAGLISGITGLTTNALNINNSLKRRQHNNQCNSHNYLTHKLDVSAQLFHTI